MRSLVLGLCVTLSAIACSGDDDDDGAATGSGGKTAQANSGSGGRGGAGGATGTGGNGSGAGGSDAMLDGGTAGGGLGGDGGLNIDPNSPTARTAACIEYVRGFCEGRHACSEPSDPELIARCLWSQARTCPDRVFAEGSTRTVEGTIACADEWRALPCRAAAMGASPDCSLPGTLAIGAKCVYATQCASRSCDGFNLMCGTCVEWKIDCTTDQDCGVDAVCLGGRCFAAEPDAGAPMEIETLALGETCVPGARPICAGGYCKPGTGNDIGVCTLLPRLGEDCAATRKCELGNSYCDSSFMCAALPAGGAACATDWAGIHQCPTEAYCDVEQTPAVCHSPPKLGEACRGTCESKAVCTTEEFDMADGTCVRPRMPGESCDDPNDACLPGATRCESGVCVLVESQGLAEQLCKP